jgi:hypothetical protein
MAPGWRVVLQMGEKRLLVQKLAYFAGSSTRAAAVMQSRGKGQHTSFPLAVNSRKGEEHASQNGDVAKGERKTPPIYVQKVQHLDGLRRYVCVYGESEGRLRLSETVLCL